MTGFDETPPPSWQEIAEALAKGRDDALAAMERAIEERDRMERVAAEKTAAEFERNQLRVERDALRGQVERDDGTIGNLGTELVRLRQELDEGFDERSRLQRDVESLARRCAVRYEETEKLRTELEYAKGWEYFAGLAFSYFDAPSETVEQAWTDLAVAIKHYRATGGREPRDPDGAP